MKQWYVEYTNEFEEWWNWYRTFFAFDPRRTAILLIGGDKTGDKRFYERMVPIADTLFDTYLKELKDERDI